MSWLDHSIIAIAELSWRASVLILAFATLRRFARRWIPARIVFLGWGLIAVRMVVPVSVPSAWSPFQLLRPVVEAIRPTAHVPSQSFPENPTTLAQSSAATSAHVWTGKRTSSSSSWTVPRGLGVCWLFGAGVLLFVRLRASAMFRRQVHRGRQENDPRILALLTQESRSLRLGMPPRIITSAAISIPAITGTWRACLLMPVGFSHRLADDELRFVLRHELGHWCRRDLLMLTILHAAVILHWFNPLAWLAARLARRDCEFACDEFVLRRSSASPASAYGATLLKTFATMQQLRATPAALGIFEDSQQLKRRIEMIISYQNPTLLRTLTGVALTAMLLVTGFTHESLAAEAASAVITTEAPTPWFENGSAKENYVVGVDSTQKHIQPNSAYVKSTAPAGDGFGGMMQTFSAVDFRGKRVRFSAWVKTAEVPKGANLWVRVDAGANHSIQFDNMSDRPVKDTSDWTHCAVVLDVPPESTDINVGFFISGTGQAWVNDAKFEVVGPEVATTGRVARKAPGNLAFNPTVTK